MTCLQKSLQFFMTRFTLSCWTFDVKDFDMLVRTVVFMLDLDTRNVYITFHQ